MRYRIADWLVLTAILAVYGVALAVTPIDYSQRATLLLTLSMVGPVTLQVLARRRAGEAIVEWRPAAWFWLPTAAVLAAVSATSLGVVTGAIDRLPIGHALLFPMMHAVSVAMGSVVVGRTGLLRGGQCVTWEHYRPTLVEEDGGVLLGWQWAQPTSAPADPVYDGKKPHSIRVPAEHADAVRQAVAEIEAALAQAQSNREHES
ncbi:MAG: hypothetical protein AAF805_13420 [Planctomycetota bacterium]